MERDLGLAVCHCMECRVVGFLLCSPPPKKKIPPKSPSSPAFHFPLWPASCFQKYNMKAIVSPCGYPFPQTFGIRSLNMEAPASWVTAVSSMSITNPLCKLSAISVNSVCQWFFFFTDVFFPAVAPCNPGKATSVGWWSDNKGIW